jgi:hypothetical protein
LQQSKRTVAELPCSLSVWDKEDPVPRTWCSSLGLVGIATWQPVLVQRSRETWRLPCTPSCFSALLKHTLQKINYAIAAQHNPKFMSFFTTWASKTRVKAPATTGLLQEGSSGPGYMAVDLHNNWSCRMSGREGFESSTTQTWVFSFPSQPYFILL